MSPSVDTAPPAVEVATKRPVHYFAPLSADEIAAAANIVKSQWPANTNLHFKAITLQEPPKAEVLPLLEAENAGKAYTAPDRKAFVNYMILQTDKSHEAVINLSTSAVERHVKLGAHVHTPIDGAELLSMEKTCLDNAQVQEAIAKLQLPKGTVLAVDPWIYGSDGDNDHDRMAQCYLYMRDPLNPSLEDSNYFAFPLPIAPVINYSDGKLVRIDYLPTGHEWVGKEPGPWKPTPPSEYVPEGRKMREDLKPLLVVQPEGASFTVTEQGTSSVIEWQKWSFRVGVNRREGTVLYNVRYDGRDLFYRVSLSDMNIPYADPRAPYHRKAAFDLGDVGAGVMANDLALGCDCLGSIYYLSATLNDENGGPLHMPNCVCVHEQDNGISWKHTNYRTGRAVLARNRELVVQSIITVANYEYILAYIFNQAGEFHYEVRATGVLSTHPVDQGVTVPWGTVVHPGVLAVYHQHIFSLRVDPMIDGHANRLVYQEAHAIPRGPDNPHGTGYTTKETLVAESGGYDADYAANRVYKIQHATKKNPVNGLPVSYKIHAPAFQPALADADSFNRKRAEFSDRAIYAVKYRDDELYAGGLYTNQSRGDAGVKTWAARRDDIVDTDLVVFVQFGLNHIPRAEDFPVMPAEIIKVAFKPVNFFSCSPALDVPPSTQSFNRSVLLSENGNGHANGNDANGNGTNGNGTNGHGTNGHGTNGHGAACH